MDTETANRTRKAALLAKHAIDCGVTAEHVDMILDLAPMRTALLAEVVRPANTKGEKRWTKASEDTWDAVKEIVRVFG